MSEPVPVTFEPAGVTVWVRAGTSVLDAARLAGVEIVAPCGGRGVCGACGVRILAGT
ncbi:MAG: 2Fe-2S iron-sulfur cluster-binding protein, partial [Actinomycetota bacterium]|nr:2Fe-2S iron-sulfur cluster-binding protein [Actinomycetota bacterium]